MYRFSVIAKAGVPPFTPDLPEPCIMGKDATSRDFFLHKSEWFASFIGLYSHIRLFFFLITYSSIQKKTVVNAERASYKAPSFAPKISRTRSVLLNDLAKKYLGWTILSLYKEKDEDIGRKEYIVTDYIVPLRSRSAEIPSPGHVELV